MPLALLQLARMQDFTVFLPCCFIGLFYGAIFAVAIGGTAFWIWMLIDAITKEPAEGNDKIMWIVIIVAGHLIGAIIYFLVRRPERIRKFGK